MLDHLQKVLRPGALYSAPMWTLTCSSMSQAPTPSQLVAAIPASKAARLQPDVEAADADALVPVADIDMPGNEMCGTEENSSELSPGNLPGRSSCE